MMVLLFSIFGLIFVFISTLDAYNILILFPTPSISHQVPIMVLTENLVKRGHSVTVVSPNRVPGLEHNNYTYVDVSFAYKHLSSEGKTDAKLNLEKHYDKWDAPGVINTLVEVCSEEYLSEQFLHFLKRVRNSNATFDAVIIESFFPWLLVPFAHILAGKKPVVGFITTSVDFNLESDLGSFEHFSYVPSLFGSYSDKMTLWQKIENWVSNWYIVSKTAQYQKTMVKSFFKKHYAMEIEGLVEDATTKISLSIHSSNHVYFYPRLLSPNVIQVGPMHLKPPEKLPQMLQDWCKKAEKGIIYMSLGSNMKSKALPKNVISNFVRVFKELPEGYRVLWKWESDENFPWQSENILSQKWFPQQSLLAHEKVKLFITQGGLQSFQEAVHHGVSLVGIPWFGDQELNVAAMVDSGVGVLLRVQELNSYEKVKTAIHSVLFDESFSRNMIKKSAISRDFSARSVDTAAFWIEHVARHGSGDHLKPVTAFTTYFEFFCLDILSFIMVSGALIACLIYKIAKFLCKKLTIVKTFKMKIS